MPQDHYSGGLTREQFLFFEMRVVAGLVKLGKSRDDILAEIFAENLFQFPTERMIKSIANTCFKRIDALDSPELVSYLADSSAEVAKQINLYAIMCENSIVYDFMTEVIGEKFRSQQLDFSAKDVNVFFMELAEKVPAVNDWSESTIQFTIDLPNYDRKELGQIADLMMKSKGYSASEAAKDRMLDITDHTRKDPNFANAREMRHIIEQVIMCQNVRCAGTDDKTLEIVDVNAYIKDSHISLPTSGDGAVKKILTAEDELEALIGLRSVKRMIKKIKAYAKRNKDDPDLNLHMCFCGNPGTGKTEVARILSRILYEAGVLPEAKLTETDSQGLISNYVGDTASKTLAKINDSMGGVLFIDEAYSLTGGEGDAAGYGDEAVAVLLKQMEDKRGQFCVILAGYKTEMEKFIGTNPGFASRVQFTLDFPDYTREELSEIACAFLSRKKYEIEDDALELLLDIAEYYRSRPNFANARTIRNILEQVIMNQNLRTDEEDSNDTTLICSDVQDYIDDEGIDLNASIPKSHKIGF